mgnify:CR=1 FL=1
MMLLPAISPPKIFAVNEGIEMIFSRMSRRRGLTLLIAPEGIEILTSWIRI